MDIGIYTRGKKGGWISIIRKLGVESLVKK